MRRSGYLREFRNGDFPVGTEPSILDDFCKLRTNGSVQKRYSSTYFATEWVKESVVLVAGVSSQRFVAALRGGLDGMTQAYSTTDLEFPVVQMQSRLLGWGTKAKGIADAPA